VLVAAGVVSALAGLAIWTRVPRSDTATSTLVLLGLPFVLCGAALAATGIVVLRRRRG
jgi:uncharacterized membrane protein HdeD (DUF308 family)